MSLLPSNRRTVAAVATLVASDILLAVMAWQVALVVRNAFGHYPSSANFACHSRKFVPFSLHIAILATHFVTLGRRWCCRVVL
jgi:hypothetical protein